MERHLKTRNVFLDTSVFCNANFSAESRALAQLEDFAKHGQVKLFITDVTIREMRQQIAEHVSAASRSFRKAWQSAHILRNVPDLNYFEIMHFDPDSMTKTITLRMEDFVKRASFEIIPIEGASSAKIFDCYFSCSPPFGEGRKKSEFPDAFVLEALCAWCEKCNTNMYVISLDADFASACQQSNRLFYLKSLEDFLNLALAEEELSAIVINLLKEHCGEAAAKIETAFDRLELRTDHADIEMSQVEADDFVWDYENLISFDRKSAVFEVSGEMRFKANLVQQRRGHLDDEWSESWTVVRKKVDLRKAISAEIILYYDLEDLDLFEIECNFISFGIKDYVEIGEKYC